MTVLTIENLSHAFGGLKAVDHFNLKVGSGELIAIIGPNGAGKTTIFNLLCGVYPLQHGTIHLDHKQINGLPVHQITRAGIARTFQNIRLFKALTVLDNILIAMNSRYNLISALLRQPSFRTQEKAAVEQAYQLLERFNLAQHAKYAAQDLPYGVQRRLEIARALATKPKVLLLDEPACGMNPTEAHAMAESIREIQKEQQLAVLLIDHQMAFVMSLAQQILVLHFGKTIATGDPDYIRSHPDVIDSYLGNQEYA